MNFPSAFSTIHSSGNRAFLLSKIEAKLDSFDAAKKKTYDNENEIIRLTGDIDGMKERIGQLEDSNKWLARTLAAAIITAVVGVVFVLIRMGAGI